MTGEQAADILIRTLREDICRVASHVSTVASQGQVPTVKDPFTGQMVDLPMDAQVLEFAKQLHQAGFGTGDVRQRQLKAALIAMLSGPVFNLLSAIDGEGAFVEDASLKVCTSAGQALPECLHEMLFPIGPESEEEP